MHPRSSSTSSSEPAAPGRWGKSWSTLAWALVWLLVLDVGVNLTFAFPSDPRNVNPGRLQLFFDYGRSMEGRLRRMTRADPAATAPITLAGWYQPLKAVERPAKPGGAVVSIYGMSHAVRLADALERTSDRYSARSVGAPGATTNWAFGAYRRDRDAAKSRVAVLAVMSSTLPNITSMTAMTWNVSFPIPYTEDRYLLDGGRLRVVKPPYDSFAGYVAALNDQGKWDAALHAFERYDTSYDAFMLEATPLDHSSIVRMIRRAWINRRDREAGGKVLSARGFDAGSEQLRVANAIIAEFSREARARGQLPVIYVVNNYGYGDQLRRALQATLDRDHIAYLSSDAVVNPNDPANYLPDTHFTEANDDRLAEALDELIGERLAAGDG